MTQTTSLAKKHRANNPSPNSAVNRLTKNKRSGKHLVSKLRSAGLYETADKINNCSIVTVTSECEEGHVRVKSTFRCKNRFCPVCDKVTAAQVSREMTSTVERLQEKYPGLILRSVTFTIPVRKVEEVSDALTSLNTAFNKMLRRRRLAKSLVGSFRGIHLKCNPDKQEVNIHIHALFAFKSTFKSRNYVSEKQWGDLWRESFGDHSITQVKSKKLTTSKTNPSIAQAAGSSAAYAVKAIELEKPPQPLIRISSVEREKHEKSLNFLKVLHDSLLRRKLYSFTGELRNARSKKSRAASSEDVCSQCSSPLTERQQQWDQQAGEYIDCGKIINEFDGSAEGKQIETNQIEIGYEIGRSPFPKKRERGQDKSQSLQVPSP